MAPALLATQKGLEPSTSSVTGWRSNQAELLRRNGGNYRFPQPEISEVLKANKIKAFKNESLIIIHNLRQTYDKFTNTKESPQRITTGVPVVV